MESAHPHHRGHLERLLAEIHTLEDRIRQLETVISTLRTEFESALDVDAGASADHAPRV